MSNRIRTACVLASGIAVLASTVVPAGTVDLQWPWWRGPHSNGSAVDYDGELKPVPSVLWKGATFTKRPGGSIMTKGQILGGCQSLVMHNDRIYVSFFVGRQSPVALDKRAEDDFPELQEMEWNMYADDVIVCLDRHTSKLLWRTAVPGGLNVATAAMALT